MGNKLKLKAKFILETLKVQKIAQVLNSIIMRQHTTQKK